MSTTEVTSWAVDLSTLGPIYPFVGTEMLWFVLGLVFWIGWTILTIRVEPEGETITPSGGGPGSATTPDPGTSPSTEGSADPGS